MKASLILAATTSATTLTIVGVLFPAFLVQAKPAAMVKAPPKSKNPPKSPQKSFTQKRQPSQTFKSVGIAKLNQQGSQLVLNGRSMPMTWSQWQSAQGNRIFLGEAALTQLLGIQLLSTNDPNIQPIAWFSDPEKEIARLPVRIVGVQRHLDITDFAKRANWYLEAPLETQSEAQRGPLKLASLSAKVQSLQASKQPWGDRIEISLDAPVPYEWDAQSQEYSFTFAAQTDASIVQPLQYKPPEPQPSPISQPSPVPQPSPDPASPIPSPSPQPTPPPNPYARLKSFQTDLALNQTTLKLGIPIGLRPQISTYANPPRIIIDIGIPTIPSRKIVWTPGLQWQQQTINGFPVNWLEVDPKQPGLNIQPILPNRELAGTAVLFQTAQQNGAIAAINGGFFNRNNLLPLGAIRVDRTWRSGPILTRGVVAWNPGGDFKFERLVSQEAVTVAPQRFPLTTSNSAYLQAGIARYTPEWGLVYSSMTNAEVVATIQDGRVIDQKPAETVGTIIPIPANSYLLVFRSNKTAAAKFPIGTTVQLESTITPDVGNYQQVIGGGPLLIKNGQIVLDGLGEQFSPAFVNELAARSAIGQTASGQILIVAAQNTPDSKGPTLREIAQIMQQLGAVNALNLDGGSSTTLYLGGQIVDRAPRSSARVHNAIGVFIEPVSGK